jgi:phosphatidate phosphatase APP1
MRAHKTAQEVTMPSGGVNEQPAWVEVYSGWATTQRGGFLYGRVNRGEPLPLPEPGDGLATKLHQTCQDLDAHGLAHAQVRLSGLHGSGVFTADSRGFLKMPLPAGMQQGAVGVTAQLEMPNYATASATTMLQVWGATDPPLGVISDIDDTLTNTGVTHKLELFKNILFHNTYNIEIFANAPQTVTAIAGKSDPSLLPTLPLFYLSGSPWALHERISQAFDRLGLPHGATILRRYSQEPLDPYDFKHPHLLEIVDANPGYKWILFGDTGEKDPEVYRALMQERRATVYAVFIHNVTGADPRDARFTDFTVFTDWKEVLDDPVAQLRLRKGGSID